jgi:hypothetical protein
MAPAVSAYRWGGGLLAVNDLTWRHSRGCWPGRTGLLITARLQTVAGRLGSVPGG